MRRSPQPAPSPERTVAELVRERPACARALEALGIDTCCEAERPLRLACRDAGTTPHRAIEAIERAEAQADRDEGSVLDCLEALVAGHRDLRTAIERVGALADVVSRTHSAYEPALGGVVRDLLDVRERIDEHVSAEETALFARVLGAPPGELHEEQERVEALRRDLRGLAADYAATPHACPSAHALLVEVRALEGALAEHLARQRALDGLLAARTS